MFCDFKIMPQNYVDFKTRESFSPLIITTLRLKQINFFIDLG